MLPEENSARRPLEQCGTISEDLSTLDLPLDYRGVTIKNPPLKDQIREFEKEVFIFFQNRPNLKRLLLFFSENLEDFASFLTSF